MSNNNYFYVGLITLLLLASTVSLILWKNSVFTRVKSYELIGEFEAINGLLVNAVVKYRGYPIGRVSKILPNQENILVHFFVNEQFNIPKGSTVKIVFDGLVGEKYMEIIPNPLATDFYSEGARIIGYSSSGLSDFIDVGTQNLMELKSILKTMSSVFGSEEISYALKEVVFSMQDAAENLERVIDELSKISNSQRISKILIEFESLLTNINKAIDQDDFQKVDDTIANLEEFSRTLRELVTDTDLKESIISTVKGTQETFEQSSNFLTTISRIKLLTSADFNYKMSSDSFLVYYLNFNFWLDNTFLNFGFSNYFKEDKLVNVLFNVPFNDDVRFRYGLIKSSPGFGIMYNFNTPFSASFNMYNFEDPYLDFAIHYEVMNQVLLNAGYNELNQSSRSLFLGFSIAPEN